MVTAPEADVIQGLVVDAEGLIGVLDQLVDGKRRVVRLHHRVRHLFNEKVRLRIRWKFQEASANEYFPQKVSLLVLSNESYE